MESRKEYLAFLILGVGIGVTVAGISSYRYQMQRNHQIEGYLRTSASQLFGFASSEFSNGSLETGAKLVGAGRAQLVALRTVNNSQLYRQLYNISGTCYWNGGRQFQTQSVVTRTAEKCSQVTDYVHRNLD